MGKVTFSLTMLVSIVMPTKDRYTFLSVAVRGILTATSYTNFEMIIVDNGTQEQDALALLANLRNEDRCRVLQDQSPFNFSYLTNIGAKQARGDIILLLNNDIEIIDREWLSRIVNHFDRIDVGIVGARLLYPDRRIQHAGVRVGPGENIGHRLRLEPGEGPKAPHEAISTVEMDAVTGACLAIRTDLFVALGGLDESFPSSFNDVDLCFRAKQEGNVVVYAGDVVLIHHESVSRGAPQTLAAWANERADLARFWRKHSTQVLDGRLQLTFEHEHESTMATEAGAGWLF